jgi:hypothetical protein
MSSITFLDIFVPGTNLLVVAVILKGLGLSLARIATPNGTRLRTWLTITLALLAWCGVSTYLAAHDVFRASSAFKVPPLPFAVFLPIIAGLWLIFRSRIMAKIIDATPLSWLVGVQVYRVEGVVFLILLGAGQLPREFALPAGSGDVLVGLLALPVAWAVRRGSKRALTAAYVWNALGILDFVVAMATGFLTSPSPLQLLAFDRPNLIASAYPLVMIPVFLVPLSSILHGLCLWKLRRLRQARGIDGTSRPFTSAAGSLSVGASGVR